METINWGIIGLGDIAQKFSEGFAETDNAKLLAVASTNYEKLSKFKKKFFIDDKYLFNNYDQILNCKDVDIIYIALPNSLHHEWVIKAIKNKKNVLVEKPATLNLLEAQDIQKNLNGTNLFFGEAFMYRYYPQLNLILENIKNNEIGNLISMKSFFGLNLLTKKKLIFFNKKKKINIEDRKFNKKLGGGCILDLGCYTSSLSLLVGSIIKKNNLQNLKLTKIKKEIGETGVDIDAFGELNFFNGFKSEIHASFKNHIGHSSVIIGEKGSIIINNPWFNGQSLIKVKGKSDRILDFDKKKNIYSYQIKKISKNLADGIFYPNFPAMNLNETLLNMKILDQWSNEPK